MVGVGVKDIIEVIKTTVIPAESVDDASLVVAAPPFIVIVESDKIVMVCVLRVCERAPETESQIRYALELASTFCEHPECTQLKAAPPNDSPLVDLCRQRHGILDGDLHCSGVYSDLMKLFRQSRAQSGTILSKDESDVSAA